ncbi:anthrone oxygenase family protein [Propionibacteriaceae bacterium Y1685]
MIVLSVVTCITVGLLVGVELAVATVLHPLLVRLPAGPSLAARADSARRLGRTMPFWYAGSVLLSTVLAILTWGTPAGSAALLAATLLALSVALTVLFLVPINNRSATWTPASHPDDWREQHRRWDRLHIGRVAIIATAFVLITVSASA